jgi:hypothetical protein
VITTLPTLLTALDIAAGLNDVLEWGRAVQRSTFDGGQEGEGPDKALVERDVGWGLPGEIAVLDASAFTLDDYRRFASDPAFAKAQEELQWCLRDAHEASRATG